MKMLRDLQVQILHSRACAQERFRAQACKWESKKRYFMKAWIPALTEMTKREDRLILESLRLHSRYNLPGMIIPRCNPRRRYKNNPRVNMSRTSTV